MKPIWSSLPIAAFVVVALSPLLTGLMRQVRARLEVMLHQAAHVIAIHAAWNEALTQCDLRLLFILVARLQPLQEMIRQIGKGGHISRGDIEQMLHAPRAVGDAAAMGPRVIDERDVQRLRGQPRQVHRGHDAAESTADDGYRFHAG